MESTLLSTTKKRKQITETNCVGRQRHDEGKETSRAQNEGQQEVIKPRKSDAEVQAIGETQRSDWNALNIFHVNICLPAPFHHPLFPQPTTILWKNLLWKASKTGLHTSPVWVFPHTLHTIHFTYLVHLYTNRAEETEIFLQKWGKVEHMFQWSPANSCKQVLHVLF